MQQLLKITALLLLLTGCNTYKTKYPYSLDDFRPELRKHLEQIISQSPFGYIGDSAKNYIDNHTSEKELRKLLKSEHPILRSVAFEFLSFREDVDCTNLLIESLDDTALLLYNTDLKTTVADYNISVSKRHTSIQKSVLIDKVINHHRNLYYAGCFFEIETLKDEIYYTPLKEIIAAQYPLHATIRNDLIYKLSEYKKNEDTNFIATHLRSNRKSEELQRFDIVENNPIAEYFFNIENFHSWLLKTNQRKLLQEMFWRNQNLDRTFKSFISATAAYKSKRSAEILLDIVNKKLYDRSTAYRDDNRLELEFKYNLLQSLKKYNCPHYKNILPLIEDGAKKFSETYIAGGEQDNFQPIEVKEKATW